MPRKRRRKSSARGGKTKKRSKRSQKKRKATKKRGKKRKKRYKTMRRIVEATKRYLKKKHMKKHFPDGVPGTSDVPTAELSDNSANFIYSDDSDWITSDDFSDTGDCQSVDLFPNRKKRPLRKIPLRLPKITFNKSRRGKKRVYLKFDRRSCRGMRKIFDMNGKKYKKKLPSQRDLSRAKAEVIAELRRQRRLSKTKKGSAIERAFYVATGERNLFFDWPLMINMVKNAQLRSFAGKLSGKDGVDRETMGFMEPNDYYILINKCMKMTYFDIRMTLMHECLHGTVERRGRRCHPCISADVEHYAMALLGDRDEYNGMNQLKDSEIEKFIKADRIKKAGRVMSKSFWDKCAGGYRQQPDWYSWGEDKKVDNKKKK